jgi:hypothetical protein
MNAPARLLLVDRADVELSIVAQCRLLKVARSSLYWRPAAVSEDDLRQIAKRGYEGAVTTGHDQQAQAVGLFLTDALLQI